MMQLDYTFERQIELERQVGEEEKLREQIRKKLRKAKTLDQIAEDLEEKPDDILPLYEQIREELAASQISKSPLSLNCLSNATGFLALTNVSVISSAGFSFTCAPPALYRHAYASPL